MKKSRKTKRALIPSLLAVILCVAMLVGTTFAWFTDTASTSVNKIEAGTLDVDIQDASGNSLNGKTLSFRNVNGGNDILWEPGATFKLDSFKIVNKGNLALKYEVIVNGVTGSAKLLKAIEFKATVGNTETKYDLSALNGNIVPAGKTAGDGEVAGETGLITISGHMKEDAGNEYQGLSLDGIGITVVATQYSYEYDSSDKTYDGGADATIQVNKDNIQDYLDGKYGSIDGATLVLAAGDYDKLELGRATKYAGSNTQYFNTNEGFNGTPVTLEALKASHADRYYIRSMSNVTFKAATDATVSIAGIEMTSGYRNGSAGSPCYDYVLDYSFESGGYYLAQKVYNIAFERITFTARCYILGDGDETVTNGFTFQDCKFNLTESGDRAINYACNSATPFKVSNLVVEDCTFTNCYQGVYTRNVYGVTVNDCTFTGLTHNAIAIQDDDPGCDHGAVVITNNSFSGIHKPVIRFNKVGSDTQITIKNNNATNCGEGRPENQTFTSRMVIEAESLATGVTYNISGNTWETDTDTYTLPRTFSHSQFANK